MSYQVQTWALLGVPFQAVNGLFEFFHPLHREHLPAHRPDAAGDHADGGDTDGVGRDGIHPDGEAHGDADHTERDDAGRGDAERQDAAGDNSARNETDGTLTNGHESARGASAAFRIASECHMNERVAHPCAAGFPLESCASAVGVRRAGRGAAWAARGVDGDREPAFAAWDGVGRRWHVGLARIAAECREHSEFFGASAYSALVPPWRIAFPRNHYASH